jgi:chromosome segregation ATPase
VDENSTDIPSAAPGEPAAVETSLKSLWEKARRAADVIGELRAEKRTLQSRVELLEGELRQLREEIGRRDQQLSKLQSEQAGIDPKRAALFANGEREVLATKVRELLAKIDAYL